MVRTRIAPSPTGDAHIGTIYQALINYSFAKKHKGDFIVRIEDTDRQRYVKGSEDKLFNDLEWFGLEPDESLKHGGKYGPYKQSERLDIYRKYARELVLKGHAYTCFCSQSRIDDVRKKMQAEGRPPKYDRHCLKISQKEIERNLREKSPHVIRMRIPENRKIIVKDGIRGDIEFESSILDDQVLLKSDGFPTYHLAVVVDDRLMEITHIVRGEEWISSAPKHVLLYEFFGWEMPKMFHTPIIRNPDGSKLSKRHGHSSTSWFKKQGYLPEAILNFISLFGWSHPEEKEIFDLKEFIKLFNLKDLSPVGPKFDLEKLDWMNGIYIRGLSVGKLIERLKEFDEEINKLEAGSLKLVVPLVQERIKTLSEFKKITDFFFKEDLEVNDGDLGKMVLKYSKDGDTATDIISDVYDVLSANKNWEKDKLEKGLRKLVEEKGWKPKQVFMTIRIAISGKEATPPLFDTLEVLGREKTLTRLEKAKKLF